MTVLKLANGRWGVFRGRNTSVPIAGPFDTMSEAWRWIDRHEGDPISPAEKKSDWVTSQILGGSSA